MRAARWIRVSTGSQDESTQLQVCDEAIAARGWEVADRLFRLHDKSAAKGEQQAEQDAVVDAMANGEFDILVCTESDRLDRRGPRAAYAFLWRLEIAAGRSDVVHVANDPQFGQDDAGSEVLSTMRMVAARDEIKLKKRRVNDKFRVMDDNGAFRGHPPLGYVVTGEKYAKRLVPGERAQEVRDAFAAAVTSSTGKLGKRLGITDDAVADLLRNATYSSGQYKLKRADGVTVIHRCEPLVTPEVQRRAVEAMERRRTGDNVSGRALAKDDFSGAYMCGACGSRFMHRYYSPGRIKADGTRPEKARRYICLRKLGGCGKSVHADNADTQVDLEMSGHPGTWIESVWIDGNDYQADLDRIRLELSELPKRGLSDDQEDDERARLRTERKRLEALPRETGHWEGRLTGQSLGARWDAMATTSERRAWLADGELVVLVKAAGDRSGGVTVEIQYADDRRS